MIFKDPKYIYGIELNADGLSVKNFDNVFKLTGEGAFFGPYIYKRNNYYYLFASIGICFQIKDNTCQIVVGRSDNFKGPYLSKNGVSISNNNYEIIFS